MTNPYKRTRVGHCGKFVRPRHKWKGSPTRNRGRAANAADMNRIATTFLKAAFGGRSTPFPIKRSGHRTGG